MKRPNTERSCIFTNTKAEAKIRISGDDWDNWARHVPVSKEWVKKNGDRALYEAELELVELFYAKEMAMCRLYNLELKMAEMQVRLKTIYEMPSVYRYSTISNDALSEIKKDIKEDMLGSIERTVQKAEMGCGPCPKCSTPMFDTSGIGVFCPNKDCGVMDGPLLYIKEQKEKNKIKAKEIAKEKKKTEMWE